MELEVRQRFEAIEGILQSLAQSQMASAARADARMVQFETRMDKFETRMDKSETRMDKFEVRMQKSEARADRMEARLDKRMDGIVKLIHTGMKIIVRIEAQQEKTELKLGEVTEKLDALIAVVDGVIKRPGTGPR